MRLFARASARAGPIGLDLEPGHAAAAQVIRTPQGPRLHAFVRLPLAGPFPPTSDECRRLTNVIDRRGFRGREVVVAAPSRSLMSALLELPPRASGAPVDTLAALELSRTQKLPTGALTAATWDVPPPSRGPVSSHVFAVALQDTDADALIEPLESAGLHVRSIDARPLALARLLDPPPRGTESVGPGMVDALTAILDLAWSQTSIIISAAGRVLYERAVQDGGAHQLQERLGTLLGPSGAAAMFQGFALGAEIDPDLAQRARRTARAQADTISQELQASIRYAALRYACAACTRLLAVGPGAGPTGLIERLAESAGMPVRVIRPGGLLPGGAVGSHDCDPGLIPAIALAAADPEVWS